MGISRRSFLRDVLGRKALGELSARASLLQELTGITDGSAGSAEEAGLELGRRGEGRGSPKFLKDLSSTRSSAADSPGPAEPGDAGPHPHKEEQRGNQAKREANA